MTGNTFDPALHARVTDLEVKVAYQDKTIEELDGVLREFARRVEDLERTVGELRKDMTRESTDIGPADDKPPHY